jgi:hypothetical protein
MVEPTLIFEEMMAATNGATFDLGLTLSTSFNYE